MPLINQVIAQHLSPEDMVGIGNELGVFVQQGPPQSMARHLVEGARMRVRLDVLFNLVKLKRPQIDLTPHLHELIAATLTAEQMITLCQRLGLDSKGLGLDSDGLIGWGYDPFLQRKKASVAQENSDKSDLLEALKIVRPEMSLRAFGMLPDKQKLAEVDDPTDGEAESIFFDPPKIEFDDFDLTINKFSDQFIIQASYSQGSQAGPIGVDVNLVEDEAVRSLLVNIESLNSDLAQAKAVGELMRKRLFPPDIWALFTDAKSKAEDKHDRGLRIRLRIEPAEIGMLPWEYCFDKTMDFLALDRKFPIVRYINQPFVSDDILAPRPARLLLVSAAPSDMDEIDAEGEMERIYNELQPLVNLGEMEILSIPQLTLNRFQSELIRFRPHLLHFIGHGTFDLDKGQGALILERRNGKSHPISSHQLAILLKGTDVKVMILNACETASHDDSNAFMGLAPALVRARIPAVIAMQFAMPDKTAAVFAQQIYHYLVMGLPLDRAITEARINLFSNEENIFWAIPVLFMRAKDGVIWQQRKE